MDSNRKFICFKELLAEELYDPNASIITIPLGNINNARNVLKSHDISNSSKVLLHVKINDIDNDLPEDIVCKLKC